MGIKPMTPQLFESDKAEVYKPLVTLHQTVLANRYIPDDHRPNPKQARFLMADQLEAFYGGAAGGGKSDALLMGALQYVDVAGYAAIIFRRTYPQLNQDGAIMDRAKKWLRSHDDVHWDRNDHRFTFPSGATLTFAHMQHEHDYENYLGSEFQYIGFDEVTGFTHKQYRFMFSRLRRLRGSTVPLRMRSASNPGGPGHEWVKRRFVEPEGHYPDRLFVPATVLDNQKAMDPHEYMKTMEHLDPVTRERMIRGDWSARDEGTKFKIQWFDEKIIEEEDVPRDAYFVRYWDMAATEPKKQGDDPDWTAGALVGESGGEFFIADIERFRATPKKTEDRIRSIAYHDGPEIPVYMEQEGGSSGKISIDHYGRNVLRGFQFYGWRSQRRATAGASAKEVRANPVSSAAQAGRLYLVRGTWVEAFFDEAEVFPYGEHDDQIDAVSGAHEVLTQSPVADVDEDLAFAETPFDIETEGFAF